MSLSSQQPIQQTQQQQQGQYGGYGSVGGQMMGQTPVQMGGPSITEGYGTLRGIEEGLN